MIAIVQPDADDLRRAYRRQNPHRRQAAGDGIAERVVGAEMAGRERRAAQLAVAFDRVKGLSAVGNSIDVVHGRRKYYATLRFLRRGRQRAHVSGLVDRLHGVRHARPRGTVSVNVVSLTGAGVMDVSVPSAGMARHNEIAGEIALRCSDSKSDSSRLRRPPPSSPSVPPARNVSFSVTQVGGDASLSSVSFSSVSTLRTT